MSALSLSQPELAAALLDLERWAACTARRVAALKGEQKHEAARNVASGIPRLRAAVAECCIVSGAAIELVAADILAVLQSIEREAA